MTFRNIAFLSVSFALFFVALLFVGLGLQKARTSLRFEHALTRVDGIVSSDRVGEREAVALLRDAARYARRASDWLSLLRRGYQMPSSEGLRDVLFELAEAAAAEFPGNQAIVAITVHLGLRSGGIERAAALAASHLEDPRFDSVKAEAYLAGGLLSDTFNHGDGSRESSALVRVADSGRPGDFEIAFTVTSDYRYLIDAALLHLGDGAIETAAAMLSELPVGVASELGLLVAYDLGDSDAFGRYLSQAIIDGELGGREKLLFADFALRAGDSVQALASYREVADHWAAVNNSAILEFETNPDRGIAIAGSGADGFPTTAILAETYAKLLWARGRIDDSRAVTSNAASQFADDGWIAALDVAVHRESNDPPERIVNQLWRRHLAVDSAAPVARYLAWYLSGLRDRQGVVEVIEEHDSERWTDLYWAGFAADDGRINDALDYLGDPGTADDWYFSYNRAILLTVSGWYEQALSQLDAAMVRLEGCETCRLEVALVAYRRAVALSLSGRQSEAVGSAQEALRLDPSLSEARSLLSSLESS